MLYKGNGGVLEPLDRCVEVRAGFVCGLTWRCEVSGLYLWTLLFLAGIGCAVSISVMYGGRGKGLWPSRRHVFGTGGFQSSGSILKRRDTSLQEAGHN